MSPTKAYGSLSDFYSESWNNHASADVIIDGNNVTLTALENERTKHVTETVIYSITDNEMMLKSDWKVFVDGEQVIHEVWDKERYVRVTNDYQEAILGMWEGKVTSDEDEHTDGELHRWEYRNNGTYGYYSKVGDAWTTGTDVRSEYFVDGTLLCTRWQKTADSEELREWWEIESIKDGVMKWKALRMREDGTTYTATFEMTKVALPTQEEIRQNIIGKWVATEIDGQAAQTDQIFTYDFMESDKGAVSFSSDASDKKEFGYTVNYYVITFSFDMDEQTTMFHQLTVLSISANRMECVLKQATLSENGLEYRPVTACTFEKRDE